MFCRLSSRYVQEMRERPLLAFQSPKDYSPHDAE